jgi:hypothetical protein
MKNTLIILLFLTFTFAATAKETLDDSISEILAPLLSNYVGDHQIRISAEYKLLQVPGTLPIVLTTTSELTAESLQDCDEGSISLVCNLANSINNWLQSQKPTNGKVYLHIKLFNKTPTPVKEFKDIEVFSYP